MKYQNLTAFEKHLEQTSGSHLSKVFLIISGCAHERRQIAEHIALAIERKEGNIQFAAPDASAMEEVIEQLNTTSLLAGKGVFFLDGIDKLKKQAIAPLASYVVKPSPFSYLILGASSGKTLGDLYLQGKKELIACDLTEEKPWDRKERIKRSLLQFAAREGKSLKPDALEHLVENVGLDLPALEQEVTKLITYVGERKEIVLSDVDLLCPVAKSATLWQLAEAAIWQEKIPKLDESIDLGFLLPLIGQLRTHLQNGLTIAELLARGASSSDIRHTLPALKPAFLDRALATVPMRRAPFFKAALNYLFEMEFQAKNGSLDPALLLELFLIKITQLKKPHALPPSQSPRRS
ncbi:MAG: hypothetical protein JSS61_03940 [Verrucomicrobia bacterium]|nr:hypothetical protein [Verrucomicrobiota bacterium]